MGSTLTTLRNSSTYSTSSAPSAWATDVQAARAQTYATHTHAAQNLWNLPGVAPSTHLPSHTAETPLADWDACSALEAVQAHYTDKLHVNVYTKNNNTFATEHPFATAHPFATVHPYATEHPYAVEYLSVTAHTLSVDCLVPGTYSQSYEPSYFPKVLAPLVQREIPRVPKSSRCWSPVTEMVLKSADMIQLVANVYIDETRETSVMSLHTARVLGLRARTDIKLTAKEKRRSKIVVETLDGFFSSRPVTFEVRRRCRGRPVILGRDFLERNSLHLDYVKQTCRYDVMAYDILTGNPMLHLLDNEKAEQPPRENVIQPPEGCVSELHRAAFTEQLRDRMLMRDQEINRLCERPDYSAALKRYFMSLVPRRIQVLEKAVRERANPRLPEQTSLLQASNERDLMKPRWSSAYQNAWRNALSKRRVKCKAPVTWIVSDFAADPKFGGGRFSAWAGSDLVDNVALGCRCDVNALYQYIGHCPGQVAPMLLDDCISVRMPLHHLCGCVAKTDLLTAMASHDLFPKPDTQVNKLKDAILVHEHEGLPCCQDSLSTFRLTERSRPKKDRVAPQSEREEIPVPSLPRIKTEKGRPPQSEREESPVPSLSEQDYVSSNFPPKPPTEELKRQIIRDFSAEMTAENIIEAGCAVCGQLALQKDMEVITDDLFDVNLLRDPTQRMTRQERRSEADPIRNIRGPVIEASSTKVCSPCLKDLKRNKVPRLALVNGNWIGDVPEELKNLTMLEQMLISRLRHNACVLKVHASGQWKMKANAVMFSVPMPKVYKVLPPPREEFEEIVAFIFIGPTRPTDDVHKRLPSFVRRNVVKRALEWLKLNHEDYSDLDISYDNLAEYPEAGPPVIEDYRPDWIDKELENKAVHELEDWSAVEEGDCPLIVHTLTLDQLMNTKLDVNALKTAAKQHLLLGGHALAIGRSADPESIYSNPQMYPKAFPWLFPYGLGGIGNKNGYSVVGDKTKKRALLLYHDKRFQKDPIFSLVALNHEQIKQSTTGSFVTVKKGNFDAISNRILNADVDAMDAVLKKLTKGGQFDLTSESEKMCFDIINDLDHVGKFVQGSRTNKRFMRNEIWSLIAARGAPSWFITFAPMDQRHPVSVYNAAEDTTIFPQFFPQGDRARMIGNNATACARFFKFMVDAFVKHVLGVGTDHDGIFGETDGYYGTVEEQGRLTLHLHTMLWIRGSLTPQQIRDRLTKKDGAFQKSLVEYLEGCHRGSFLSGASAEVESRVQKELSAREEKFDPVLQVPESPPDECSVHSQSESNCGRCTATRAWVARFKLAVDEILHRFNRHDCTKGWCKNPRYPNCKARFPRDVIPATSIDPNSGYLKMRHGESMMNTYNEVLTYLMMSNTDVTSLLSGTAMKAVIAYTTDYITKPGLRTHTMMEIIKSVFTRNSEFLQGSSPRAEKARRLMVQIVNAMTVKQEIGSPMACAHLLGHPDHYTNYKFKPFYWRMFVGEVKRAWGQLSPDSKYEEPSVIVARKGNESGDLVALSPIVDYQLRPPSLQSMSLYDWVRLVEKQKVPKKKSKPVARDLSEDEAEVGDMQSDEEGELDTPPVTRGSARLQSQKTLVGGRDDDGYSSDDTLIDDNLNDEDYEMEDDENKSDSDIMYRMPKRAKKSRSGVREFAKEHPQYKTHRIRVLSEDQARIPNFLGGVLPRKDKGDVDEYYRAMLTLFKPWSDPKSLKTEDQTWEDAFKQYHFSARQRQVMGFFHVRYECNDARDDFRAQRVSSAKDEGLHWIGGQFIHELDREAWATEQLEALGDDMAKIDHAFEPMRYGQRMVNASIAGGAMKHALESVGWVNPDFANHLSSEEALPDNRAESTESTMDVDGNDDSEPSLDEIEDRPLSKWRDLLSTRRKEVIAQKAQGIPDSDDKDTNPSADDSYWEDTVRIVDNSFLSRTWKSKKGDVDCVADNIVKEFTLNEEQERAFRIIANHSDVGAIADPLKMYIGGMAGTGKSQVIKALVRFFELRGKSYAFLILAPTGSAASLIGGSTYHSALGFRGSNRNDGDGEAKDRDPLAKGMTTQQAIKARLKAVEYVFIDEISMVDCKALYDISGSMNTAMNIQDEAFAGKNMIFAGDFAQLPPISVAGPPLFSGLVSANVHTTNSVKRQRESIGKALWHQFTVVVMLTQNMRQKTQSEEDAKFRKLLVNLRVKSCDRDDLELMHSRVPRDNHPDIDLMHPDFVHASMITRRNSNRDLLNDIGTARFARDKRQKLHTFYAVDTFSNARIPTKEAVFEHNPLRTGNIIPTDQAEKILAVPPGDTMSIPGKLTLCKGLPVIIKRNDATELNVTNGAEATVRDWRFSTLRNGRSVLDVVFVELKSPPSPIKLDGLPLNVVPICRAKQGITVMLPDGNKLPVNRDQVPLLPNFAMTDYASQGRTRPINIVDLEHCDTHQSIYTCLSRASTLKGTVIFRMCNHALICGGLNSGRLKQEFRELELLNEITRLRWEGTLSKEVGGNTRSTLLKSYLKVYGRKSCPKNVHPAIRWGMPGENDPLKIDYDDDPSFKWKSIEKSRGQGAGKDDNVAAKQQKVGIASSVASGGKKRKASALETDVQLQMDVVRPQKKPRKKAPTQLMHGLRWRQQTQTCAYDSILSVLANVYWHNAHKWGDTMSGVNSVLEGLVNRWALALQTRSFDHAEAARDSLQTELNACDPEAFPIDGGFTDIAQLIITLFGDDSGNRIRYTRTCVSCNTKETPLVQSPTWNLPVREKPQLLSAEIKHRFQRASEQPCRRCGSKNVKEVITLNHNDPPPFIAIGLEDRRSLSGNACQPKLTSTVSIGDKTEKVAYKLRGLVYWDGTHFTCRMLGKAGQVYYNDGMVSGFRCIHEGGLADLTDQYNVKGSQLTYIILSLL